MSEQNQQVEEQVFDLDAVFDNAGGGGGGAPSFEWPTQIDPRNKNRVVPVIGGEIVGEITDVYVSVVKDATTKLPKLNRKGAQMPQVNLTVKTNLRNWEGCTKVPLSDPDDVNSAPADPAEDTGERRIYVKYRMLDAVAAAIQKSDQKKGGPRKGAMIAVKVSDLTYDKDPLRHPLPDYEAQYKAAPEDPAADVFNAASATQGKDPFAGASTTDEPPF